MYSIYVHAIVDVAFVIVFVGVGIVVHHVHDGFVNVVFGVAIFGS
jgi:hypothetical protein